MYDEPHTILIVDDSPFVRKAMALHLGNQGFRVELAEDGSQALCRIDEELIDLVLLDINMPGMSGIAVLETLRREHSPSDLPIVIATANTDSNLMVGAFERGANDYVTKPFDPRVVVARIQTQLRGRLPSRVRAGMPNSAPVFADLGPGSVLDGKYRLEAPIGHGQYGAVYRATHLELARPVAVKLLRADVHSRGEARIRFLREGISTCRIQHPNAVAVLDFSLTRAGVPYLVMELLEGRSLAEEIKAVGPLSARRCAEILTPICEVLSEAHDLGIIHRDIKPQNIFLHSTPAGERVKVLDFGIAKLVGDTIEHDEVTLEGCGPGTPAYMAPERFGDQIYDGRTDVYSLGVMLYGMLAGELPFVATEGNLIKLALMHRETAPRPLREVRADLPQAVGIVVSQALEKDYKKRPTAAELGRRFAAAVTA